MRLASQPIHQRCVHSGPLVLGAAPVNLPAPAVDRDQTVSRRFKPSSRTSLNGEQPYPWDRLQPQDEMSRHRGAKHRRRYELLGGISLLSPEYLLSVERWPFHSEPPDHYDLLSHLLELLLSQSSTLLPLHYQHDFRPYLAYLRTPPLPFRRRPPQSNCLPCTVPASRTDSPDGCRRNRFAGDTRCRTKKFCNIEIFTIPLHSFRATD